MRVVISAYACDPGGTSERGIGWTWAAEASRRHDVHLITRTKFRPAVTAALERDPELRITPTYVDLPEWCRWWKRGERGLYPYYLLWQVAAWRVISARHRDQRFDVGHHLTFGLDWLPAGVAFVRRLPIVWGPVGPGVGIPPLRLARFLGPRWLAAELLRGAVTSASRRTFGALSAHRANVMVGNNEEVAAQYAKHRGFVLEQHSYVELPATERTGDGAPRGSHAISVGRLVTWKGVDIAIRTISRSPGWRLSIYGEGPAEPRLRRRVRRLGLDDRVAFRGRVPQRDVLDAMLEADVLLFASVRDSAPVTVAEAITVGLPVVCLDIGGPGSMVRDGEGVRVAPDGSCVDKMAGALCLRPSRHQGSDRWGTGRIGPLLDTWYTAAVRHAAENLRVGR